MVGAKSNDKSEWKYNYGETDRHCLLGLADLFSNRILIYTILQEKMIPAKLPVPGKSSEYEMSTSAKRLLVVGRWIVYGNASDDQVV